MTLPRLPLARLAVLALALAALVAPAHAATPAGDGAEGAAAAAPTPLANARQLTFEGRRAGEGYFSADGRYIVFQSERAEGNPFFQIYRLDLETGDVERLSTGVGKTTCAWLHPDGERALFASTQFDPEAEDKMQAELDFRASGQTRRYAWDYDPTYEIVETNIEEGGFTRLTDAEGYDAEGAYSPDGTRIVFASNRHAYAADLSAEEAALLERDPSYFMELYVMDADGSNVRRLTETPGYDGGPFWSADGSRITWRRFGEKGATAEIYVMDPDAGQESERRLTDLGHLSWAPFFHPSGDYILFSTNLLGFANFELFLVDVEGTRKPVRVTEREGFDGLPSFAPDGETVSWTSNATADGGSQLFIADWDHEAALALLDAAPRRASAGPALAPGDDAITTADLRAHVRALTDEAMAGRLTGTEGERLATDYVARAFARAGLAPAGSDGFFQPFELTTGVTLAEGNRLSVSVDGEAETLTLDEAWRPLSFSATGAVEAADVVFAGYGIVAPEEGPAPALDSYGDIDVSGSWVLVWQGMPGDISAERRTALARYAALGYRASVARARGAKGLIVAPPPREGFEDALPPLRLQRGGGASGLPVVAVDRASAARMLSILDDREALAEAADAGETAARRLIGVEAEATVALTFETGTGRNVVGRLALGAGDAPPLVIGAHVDHLGRGEASGSLARGEEMGRIHPGADDNASGVAALLEVADHLAALAREGRLEGPRDIVFAAWSGEELGLLGAAHYVDALIAAEGGDDLADTLSAYINMDMIGRLEDRVIAGGTGSSPVWEREIERRNAVVGLPIVTSADPFLPTDATEFYLAGVPVLSLFTGAHDDYHRPGDTAEKLNYDGIRDIARFVALVARSRATAGEEPPYVERARPASEGGRRMAGVFLGTIPDYAEEGQKGVPLSGVVTGGPAEDAGMTGGDVLVGLAGQELENIYDFVRVLNGLKPGETVAAVVERDGGRVELDVTPRRRE